MKLCINSDVKRRDYKGAYVLASIVQNLNHVEELEFGAVSIDKELGSLWNDTNGLLNQGLQVLKLNIGLSSEGGGCADFDAANRTIEHLLQFFSFINRV